MDVTFAELRRHTARVRRALERNEQVTLTYRGKAKGVIHPVAGEGARPEVQVRVVDHPAFGMWKDRKDMEDVHAWLRNLRHRRIRELRR